MSIALSMAPSGPGELTAGAELGSVSTAVAQALRVVRDSGLPHSTDAMSTTVEGGERASRKCGETLAPVSLAPSQARGDHDECMDVVRRAYAAVGPYGSRVSLVLKADIRPGPTGELTGKVERVGRLLDELPPEASGG